MAKKTFNSVDVAMGRGKPIAATQAPLPGGIWGTSTDEGASSHAAELVEEAGNQWGDALAQTVRNGWALIVSGTRDGGAVCLTLLTDEATHKRYCAGDIELAAALEALTQIGAVERKEGTHKAG